MKNTDPILIRLVTVLIYGTLALLILSSVLALSLPLLTNPSTYKTHITQMVLERFGRKLTLDGTIKVDLFPEATITLEHISLDNAPGFGPMPMVTIQKLQGKLHRMQLLKNQFTIHAVSATGVHIALERNATGNNNWDDLVTRTAIDEASDAPTPSIDLPDLDPNTKISLAQLSAIGLAALSMRGVTIKESEIHFCEQNAVTLNVSCLDASHFEAVPGAEIAGKPIAVALNTDLTTQEPPFSGHISLSTFYHPPQEGNPITRWQDTHITVHGTIDTPPIKELEMTWHSDIFIGPEPYRIHVKQTDSQLTFWSDTTLFREFILSLQGKLDADLHTGRFRMPEGGMAWQVKADYLPPAGVKLAFQSAIEADWLQETLQMEQLQASGPANIHIEGRLQGNNLLSQPSLDAQLTAFHFDPRALLTALGRQIPPTTDLHALSNAKMVASLHIDEQDLIVNDIVLDLDASHLSGNFRLNTAMIFKKEEPIIRFDLHGDTIDLDRYLPPELTSPEQSDTITLMAMAPEIFLPFVPASLLQGIDLQGRIGFDQWHIAHSEASNVSLDIQSKEQQLQLQPYRLTWYGGEINTQARWDVRAEEPLLSVDKTITDIQIAPLLQQMYAAEPIRTAWSGSADISTHLESKGTQPDTLLKNLHGTVTVAIRDGSIQGVDIVDHIRTGYLSLKEHRTPTTSHDRTDTTQFSKLTATGTLTNGILNNTDLLAVSPSLKVTGKGQVDLSRAWVNYRLEADVETALREIDTQNSADLRGMTLPIHLQGDLNTLKVPSANAIDISNLLRSALTTPKMQELMQPLGGKQKVLEHLQKMERQLGGRKAVNDLLKRLLGVEQ